jgi:hypothetical protein
MKADAYFLIFISLLSLSSCFGLREINSDIDSYIYVKDLTEVPELSQSIIVDANILQVKDLLLKEDILLYKSELGFISEEIFFDSATKGKYKLYDMETNSKIVAFWGLTPAYKAKNKRVLERAEIGDLFDKDGFKKVIYDTNLKRPKMVFDFAVEIVNKKFRYKFRNR